MIFGLLAALLVAATAYALVRPLIRHQEGTRAARGRARAYREILLALERDSAAGLVANPESDAARNKLARALIAEMKQEPLLASAPAHTLALAIAVLLALGAPALYALQGAPGLKRPQSVPGAGAPQEDLAATIAGLERKLAQVPGDPQTLQALGLAQARAGRAEAAAKTLAQAIARGADGTEVFTAYGMVVTRLADGIVTDEAAKALEQAVSKMPTNALARYFLALRSSQKGDLDAAIAGWEEVLAQTPEGSGLRAAAAERLAWARQAKAGVLPEDGAAGQQGLITAMVAGLAARLENNPNDLEGWRRLIRSYAVLGAFDKADAALAKARAVFAGDSDALKQLADSENELNARRP